MDNTEIQRKKLETGLKWGGVLLGVIGLGFLTPLIISGAIGLGVGIVAAAVGYMTLQFWPVFTRKIVNAKYKMIAAEARKNPVETNRRIYEKQQTVLEARTEATKRFAGKLANVGDTVDSLFRRFGDDEKVLKLKAAREAMQGKLERLKAQLQRARKAQTEFAAEIEKAEAIWDATQQMIEVQRLSGSAADKAIEDFESQMAFKSINEEFNTAVAELDNETDDDFTVEAEAARELPTLPHGAVTREPAPFERESSAFPRERTKGGS